MNLKKIAAIATVLSLSGLVLGACGSKNDAKNKEVLEGKEVDFKKDAVDEKTKTVDGKEVKEYTMPDGNVIQIPTDGEGGDDLPTDGGEEK